MERRSHAPRDAMGRSLVDVVAAGIATEEPAMSRAHVSHAATPITPGTSAFH